MNSQLSSLIRQAIEHFQDGNLANAEALLEKVLQVEPRNFNALHIMGVIYVLQKRHAEAQKLFKEAININPGSGVAHYNLATSLSESGKDLESLFHHDNAVKLSPNDQDAWVNYGKSLANLSRYDEALVCYENALKINPDFAEALSNQGALLAKLHRDQEALSCFEKALAINSSIPAAWSNKGNAFNKLKRYDEAVACYDRAIQLEPGNVDAWYKKGNTLNELKRHDEALDHYNQALQLNPDHDFLYGNRLSTKMSICDWAETETQFSELVNRIKSNKNVATPFDVLGIKDSPSLQRKTSDIYAKKFPVDHSFGEIHRYPVRDKIRVGYFSRDFQNHATAFLTAELFEMHDRNKFEIFAFSFGPDKNDKMRNRLLLSFDKFINVRDKSDLEIAQLSRELEIDIAVDLQGYQTEHRPGIFAGRAAPVQVNYLAYPGTLGAEYMDYIVADKTLISPESQHHYSEKIVFLPDSYQVNDRQRAISEKQFTREELGLPPTGFVFCCFNGNQKITPRTFDGWMKILREVDGSVLWLFEANQMAVRNLQREAVKRGVLADRLIFAKYMNLPEHLARHRLADLFLDTLPYNAHTTASDALWAGLPVLTCIGESFASRVAASLLNAMHMPELITHSQADYEATAIELARHPVKLADIKQKLAINRLTTPLFDTPLYAKHLEAAYTAMHARYHADLPLDHIYVK